MNRLTFFILLIFPTFFAGMFISYLVKEYEDKYFDYVLYFWILVYLPVLLIFRMRKLGFTKREMFKAMVPFWGAELKRRIWSEK